MVVHERYLGRIQSGMDVCDSRGGRLGSVARVYRYEANGSVGQPAGADPAVGCPAVAHPDVAYPDVSYDEVIEVKTGMLGLGKRLYVPFSSIQEVISDSVFLAVGGFEADLDPFKHKPEYLDKLR